MVWCLAYICLFFFFFSSRRRHTRYWRDWSSDVCSSDLSDLASNRGLGPISAVNVVFAMLVALTFLPAALTLLGRAAFWPFRPQAGSESPEHAGLWGRGGGLIRRRPVPVLAGTAAFLLAGAAFLPTLKADGIALADTTRGGSRAVDGQAVLARHFDAG